MPMRFDLLRRLTAGRSPMSALCLLLMISSLPGSASAARWALNQNDALGATFKNCGIEVSGSALIKNSDGGGGPFGIVGGFSDSLIDSGESVEFVFDEPAFGVRYETMLGEPSGSTFIQAFGPGDVSLGARTASNNTGTYSVSELFDGQPIERFTLAVSGGSTGLRWVEYAEVGPVTIDFSRGGSSRFGGLPLDYCDTRFSSTPGVAVFSNGSIGGIGVIGGFNDFLTDDGETISLEFPYPVSELSIDSALLDLDADGLFGEGFLVAYDEFGDPIGIAPIEEMTNEMSPVTQTLNVAALFPGEPISSIDIVSSSDARRIDKVVYTPEPRGAALAGLVWLVLLAVRGRGCPSRQNA